MKTFEEKYTAWVDGRLSGKELQAFEQELEGMEAAESDRREVHQLGALLRSHAAGGGLPVLEPVAEFDRAVLDQITASERGWRQAPGSWSSGWLALAGAACLAVAAAGYALLVPKAAVPVPYFAEITSVRAADPSIFATAIQDPSGQVTVLWIDGLDYLPDTYKLR